MSLQRPLNPVKTLRKAYIWHFPFYPCAFWIYPATVQFIQEPFGIIQAPFILSSDLLDLSRHFPFYPDAF